MDEQVHPLLRKDAEAEEQVPEQEALVATPAEEAIPENAEDQVADDDSYYIRLDKRRLRQEFQRLQEEEKDVANILNTMVGNKAAQKYRPKIDELEAERASLQAQLRQLQYGSMPPDQLKERLLRDPEFARQYHTPTPDPDALRQKHAVDRAFDQMYSSVEDHVSPEEMQKFRDAAIGGWYDHQRDENGQPVRALSPVESLAAMQADISRFALAKVKNTAGIVAPPEVSAARPPVTAPPTRAPAQANPRLATASPDLTPSSGASKGGVRMKLSEYNQLSPPQRIALYPSTEDFERARKSGEIADG